MYPYISKVNLWKLIQIYSVLYSGGGTFFLSDLQCALVRRRYIFLVRFTVCFSPEAVHFSCPIYSVLFRSRIPVTECWI